MAESIEGEIVMGRALPNPSGKFHIFLPRKQTSWHHDWRGKVYVNTLYILTGIFALTAIWFLSPLHRLVTW